MSRPKIVREKKIQSRSWQIIIPTGWDNLEFIKERCKAIARNYYFIQHDHDVNELCEPVKPHWHLLLSFATSRELSTMQNYFREWGDFSENGEKKENDENVNADVNQFDEKKENEESSQLLKPNSFERVYSINGARKYLVHAEDPQKFQYSPKDVETNDKLFMDLFLPSLDKISETKKTISNFKLLAECDTYDQFLSLFEEQFYTMSNSQRISHIMNLRKYYNEYKGNVYCKDGFDRVFSNSRDDGYSLCDDYGNIKIGLECAKLPF